ALAREGVEIRSGVKVEAVERRANGISVRLGSESREEALDASHLFLATGRHANVADLGLDEAGIEHDRRGVKVDRGLRTTNKRVYAVGDVAGGPQFTHVANYHAGLVIRSILFRLPVRADHDSIPWVTYTDPELAQVGLDEQRARERHGSIRVLRWPYAENDRAHAERELEGFVKLIATPRGRILGATIVGSQAGEMANLWSLALARKLDLRALTGFISPYPTLSEIGKRAAVSSFTARLTSPLVQRTLRLLRFFG
ncbi:MAG: FAD-dependent oxidoreductase, partial [Pseudomonadota bacterium]|nr:FAD-dependent oxidoreductase [Pseudomonadota bacterium]